jgi:hypothetical protein
MTPGGSSSPLAAWLDLFVGDLAQHVDLARGHLLDLVDLLVDPRVLVGVADALQVRVEMRSMVSRSRIASLVSRRLLVRSSCRSASTSLPPRIPSRRFSRSSVRMRISSARFFSSFAICSASICLARSSFSWPLRLKMLHVDHRALDARRAGQRSVAHVAGLFAEDGAQQFSSGVSCVSPLGVTLPTRCRPA